MDKLNNNSSAENTNENITEAQAKQSKPQSSAGDLLSRLNKNIAENPTSGRKYTTLDKPEKVIKETTGSKEPANVQPQKKADAQAAVQNPNPAAGSFMNEETFFADDVSDDEFDQQAMSSKANSDPLINTFEVNEKLYDDEQAQNGRRYKVRVANRAKDSRLPEKEQVKSEPVKASYPEQPNENQGRKNTAQVPDASKNKPAAVKQKGKKNSDDPWQEMLEESIAEAKAAGDNAVEESVPQDNNSEAKVKDRYEGFGGIKRMTKRAKSEEELQKRIHDAEEYVKEMQTGEISVPAVKSSAENNSDTKEGIRVSDQPTGEFDETDMNLMIAFGMEQELKAKVGEEKAEKFTESIDRSSEEIDDKLIETGEASKHEEYFEFTDPEQVKPIFKRYRSDYANMLWRILSCAVLLIITFFYENIELFGGSLPPMFNSTSYPVVHVLVGLQFLVLGGALIYNQLFNGIKDLLKMKPTLSSMAAVMIAVSLVYHIILCFTDVYTGIRLYNFPVMLLILLELMNEMNSLRQEMYSFNVAASKKPKYTIDRVSDEDSVMEREAFAEMLPESPVMFRIGKVQFVDGFYKRSRYTPQYRRSMGIIIPIAGAVSLIFLIAGLAITKSFYGGLQLGYLTMMISMPLSIFLTYGYPFYSASKTAYNHGGAIVGECSLEEYDKASVISFDDVDVFPANRVKLKTVKTFGNSRIDQVIFDAKCVFVHLGGPLAGVFTTATEIDVANGGPVEVLNIADDGVEVMLGGRHILIGKGSFLRAYRYEPINSREDEGLENSGDVTVMYMVADGEVVAKYYIQYRIDPDFDYTLTQLYKAGMCVGIRTLDPNISDFMLSTRVKISKFAVKVLKYHEPFPKRERFERVESGIISKNSPKSLLMTLALCDKVQHIIRTNLVVTIFALIISLIIMAFVLTLNLGMGALSFYIALYQAFWIVPMIIIAKLFI